MRLAGAGWAQVSHPLGPGVNNDHILVAVRLLLATIMQCLFFRVFRPLAAALSAIDDVIASLDCSALRNGKLMSVTLWFHAQGREGFQQHGQQTMDPLVRTGLAQAKQLAQDHLQWIRLLIHQDEEQLVFNRLQDAPPPTTHPTLAFPLGQRLLWWILLLICLLKGGQERLEFPQRQASQGQKFAAISLQLSVVQHAYSLRYF